MSDLPKKVLVTKREMERRRKEVSYTGWETNIFFLDPDSPFKVDQGGIEELWINVIDSSYVSKSVWNELIKSCSHSIISTVTFGKDARRSGKIVECHTFIFYDKDMAADMAELVQSSAQNKRKKLVRRISLEKSGGFHNKEVLDKLYDIQMGRCYYSGDILVKKPKNFVVDHIHPVCMGGSDWPGNLALAIREVNTWKGGHASCTETLNWLANKRGMAWFCAQQTYCREVDRKRDMLDKSFRIMHGVHPD